MPPRRRVPHSIYPHLRRSPLEVLFKHGAHHEPVPCGHLYLNQAGEDVRATAVASAILVLVPGIENEGDALPQGAGVDRVSHDIYLLL